MAIKLGLASLTGTEIAWIFIYQVLLNYWMG